ncbi:MAG: DUF2029 domain-containing protein [Pedobacter sp.]|nr:DUF2029 domain-containing protein [Chitinophagaceae bacterium]
MNLVDKQIKIYKYTFSFPTLLWFLLASIAVTLELSRGLDSVNNYLIYKGVFQHTFQQKHLYIQYPNEYDDANHYGPLFSMVIAPFAIFNNYVGCFLWCIANAAFLYFAVKKLPITEHQKNVVLLITAVEMMTSIHSVQFNPMLTSWIVLAFILIEKEQDIWATLFIVAGFYVKLYGIVGLAFFFFSKHKIKFIVSFIFWLVVLFCLPMLISSPTFIIQTYQHWFQSLVAKNVQNIDSSIALNLQDLSVLGMVRRIFKIDNLHNYFITIPAAVLLLLPYIRISQYKYLYYRLSYLALVLISVVIFSTSAESPTYVIAVTGVALWFIVQHLPTQKWVYALLIFAIIVTTFSVTDIFPHTVKVNFFIAYALKALPCFCVWLVLLWQLLFRKYDLVDSKILVAS